LLDVTRREVLEYLSAQGLSYREDATNADTRFMRNRIRHELLPLLERNYNPGIRDVLRRTAEILRAEAERDPVAAERRAIRQLSFEQVETLRKLAEREEMERVTGRWPLNMDGETTLPELGITLVCHSERSEESLAQCETLRCAQGDKQLETFDADALGTGLFVRTWQEGDRFQPLGMTGDKKLQDFFVDEKVPRLQRGRVPLLCAGNGRIAWVVGYRIAEPFKITERTTRVLCICAEPL
jgi:tRNA(Ile)-lysidine synthase